MANIVEEDRLISNQELLWFNNLKENGKIKFSFNNNFFTSAESTEPEQNETRTKVRNWVLDLFGMGKKEEDNGSDPVLDESGD